MQYSAVSQLLKNFTQYCNCHSR